MPAFEINFVLSFVICVSPTRTKVLPYSNVDNSIIFVFQYGKPVTKNLKPLPTLALKLKNL
ncbi:MAG TPA: hypothetical protein DCL43_13975 [Chitinophagaceae bacterium]|nr:hypothetical protein [Chitinophagaceae bacterium]HAN39556.1 hypothetical protein [Chitinophagaceae bacterium]